MNPLFNEIEKVPSQWGKNIAEILFTEKQILQKVTEMAKTISTGI